MSVLIVSGRAITAAMIERVEARMREKPFTATMLTSVAEDVCQSQFCDREPGMRLADRLIQRHRKAGNITRKAGPGRPLWVWVIPAPSTQDEVRS